MTDATRTLAPALVPTLVAGDALAGPTPSTATPHPEIEAPPLPGVVQPLVTDGDFVPTEWVGYLEPNRKCRAWRAKVGKYCTRGAGYGTAHVGVGRCERHGGKREGYRFSGNPKFRELYEWHVGSRDPLDLTHEVALTRALVSEFVEEVSQGSGRGEAKVLAEEVRGLLPLRENGEVEGGTALRRLERLAGLADLEVAAGMVESVSRVVERVERGKAMQSVPLPALRALVVGMAEVVRAVVKEAELVEKIEDGWGRLRIQGLGKALTVEGQR